MKRNLLLCTACIALAASCSKNTAIKASTGTTGTVTKSDTASLATTYGAYALIGIANNKAIEVSGVNTNGDKVKDSTTLQQDEPLMTGNNANRWQEWQFSKQTNGYFTIMNLNSGKLINAPGSQAAGVLFQLRANGTDAQYWSVIQVGTNTYKIINKASGLAVTNHGASTTDGTTITQEAYTGGKNQQWLFTGLAADSYRDDAVVGFFQRTSGSEAFDGGASVPLTSSLNNGKVFWQTNDVFYNQVLGNGEFVCGQIFNYHNSGLIQPASHSWDPAQTVNLISTDGVQIFHDPIAGNLLWPGPGVELGSHIYVQNIEVPVGSLSADNQYLCDITESSGTSIAAVNNMVIPGMSGQININYSEGMVKPGDGYVYAYGTGGFIGASVFVARFPETDPTTWTFWDGSTWAASPSTASAAVIASGPANNNTVAYVNGKYVLITMDFGFTCDVTTRNMYASISNSPTGPFTTAKTVYVLPDYKQGHAPVYYNPTIHSEFDNGHNELLVDYCVNFYSKNDGTGAVCLAPCSNPDGTEDPNDYRPKGVRIPYSLIGL